MDYKQARQISEHYKGEIGTYAVITTDGREIYAQAPNRFNAETLSTMSATGFGAMRIAGVEIHAHNLNKFTLEDGKNTAMYIEHIRDGILVVAKVDKNNKEEKTSLDKLILELQELNKLK